VGLTPNQLLSGEFAAIIPGCAKRRYVVLNIGIIGALLLVRHGERYRGVWETGGNGMQ